MGATGSPNDCRHGVVRQEQHVGQSGTVHAHEHVAGVHHRREPFQVTDVVRPRRNHIEAHLGRGGDGVGFILQLPRVATQDQDESGLPSAGAPAHWRRPWPLQRVGGADEFPEARHGVAVARETWDDSELLVTLQPDTSRREAAHGVFVGVHVYYRVGG